MALGRLALGLGARIGFGKGIGCPPKCNRTGTHVSRLRLETRDDVGCLREWLGAGQLREEREKECRNVGMYCGQVGLALYITTTLRQLCHTFARGSIVASS